MQEENKVTRGTLVSVMRKPGRPHIIKDADELWDLFVQYCNYVDANPWQSKSASNSISDNGRSDDGKNNAMRQDVRVLQRAYTLYGFSAFAGIHCRWNDWRRNNIEREGFEDVIYAIENVVCSQQLDGALLHQFDSNLVARLNGFADKQINEVVGKDGEKFEFPKLSAEDIEILKQANGL